MRDGLQGISHDRILMRAINYMQIIGWIGGFFWGSIQIVRAFDHMNQQISILQQQVSSLQQLVVTARPERHKRPTSEGQE